MKTIKSISALLLFAVFLIAALPGVAMAGVWPSLELNWTEPKTRENGATLLRTEISGYKVFVKAPGATAFTLLQTVAPGPDANYKLAIKPDAPKAGEYCFYLTTVDTNKLESKPSTNVCIPYAEMHAPAAPVTLRVTIQIEVEAAK